MLCRKLVGAVRAASPAIVAVTAASVLCFFVLSLVPRGSILVEMGIARPSKVQVYWQDWNHPPLAVFHPGGGRATLEFRLPAAKIALLRIDPTYTDAEDVVIYRVAFRSFAGTETTVPLTTIATWTFSDTTSPVVSNEAIRFRSTSRFPHLYGPIKFSFGFWLDELITSIVSNLHFEHLQFIVLGALAALMLSVRRLKSITSQRPPIISDGAIVAVVLLGLCVFSGIFSILAGQDVNGDQVGYHAYIPFSAVTGRTGIDIAVNGVVSFNNPLMYIPFFYGIDGMPAKAVGFCIGAFQGLNLVAAALIAWTLAKNFEPTSRLLCVIFAVGLAVALPFHQLELGRTFGDNWTSVPIVFGFFLALKSLGRTPLLLLSGGVLMGFAGGLKLTGLSSCIGLAIAYTLVSRNVSRIAILSLAFLGGFLLAAGYWFAVMWYQWENPLFPYFNAIFRSPWFEPLNWRDNRFQLYSFGELFRIPWTFAFDSWRFNEGGFTDYRWLVMCLLLGLFALYAGIQKRSREPVSLEVSLTILFVIFGFIVWAFQFHYARYLLAIDFVAQALMAFLLIHLSASIGIRSSKVRGIAGGAIVLGLILTSSLPAPVSWSRQPWGQRWYSAEDFDVPARSVVLLGNSMGSLLIEQPRRDVQYIGVGSGLSDFFATMDKTHPLRQRIQAEIKEASDRIYYVELLSLPRPERHLQAIFRQFGLTFGPCRLVKSSIADIKLCKLETHEPS